MKRRIRVLPAANADLDEIARYLARQGGVELGLRFFEMAEEAFVLVRQAPLRRPLCEFVDPRLAGIRKRAIRSFSNYYVFYRADGRMVEVIRVLHGARDLPRRLTE